VIDILEHINAIHRHVSRTGEDVSVLLKRSYGASVEDVWDALTDPERMRRWLMPITGELKIGGSFPLEGNAGGEILECEPPSRFKVTFGGPTSLLEVRLTAGAEDETTELELEHTVPAEFAGGGAGALYVGPGWDGALLARPRPVRRRRDHRGSSGRRQLTGGAALLRALRAPVDRRSAGVRHGDRRRAQRRHRGITGTVRPRRTE
jgi:uncharacterized protein YndB with AHSA1/START domain